MNIFSVPCYADNYAWILYCEDSGDAVVVDPSEGFPVLEKLRGMGGELTAIYCTHHHADHVDGIVELLEEWPEVNVYCHESDLTRIPGATIGLTDGDGLSFCGLDGFVLHTPGHTAGSCCYLFGSHLFTGDTLFGGGCGRVFEGRLCEMAESLMKFDALPEETLVYFGHEYTLDNLKFAAFLEPENKAVMRRQQTVAAFRKNGQESAPSTLAEERRSNPFLRCGEPGLASVATTRFDAANTSFSEIFAALRRGKNCFK